MRTTVAALTSAAAFAATLGIVSAAAQQPTRDSSTTTAHDDAAATTINGCLQLNAYDQYVLIAAPSSSGSAAATRATSASAQGPAEYRLLLQTDADLTQDVGKPVEVKGAFLAPQATAASANRSSEKPVATTGQASGDVDRASGHDDGRAFGVVAARSTPGRCTAPSTAR
jgi:hypothetical protein